MIYDISQELFSCIVYPGDKEPELRIVQDMQKGALYNLSEMDICVHNGTHIDAPKHFYKDGKAIDEILLEKCIGECTVVTLNNNQTIEEIIRILKYSKKHLLIKGNFIVTEEIALEIADLNFMLIGVENQSVWPIESPMAVHKILLKKEIVLLEGIVLSKVDDGEYFLSALPLKLGNCDGSPCRAVLIKND